MNRRSLIFAIPLLAGAHIGRLLLYSEKLEAQVQRADIDRLLDTATPENHCQMQHNHGDNRFDDWQGSLKWAADDCGHNEGAGAVIKLAIRNGLSFPELMRGCPDSERYIPRAEEVIKNPDRLDEYSGFLTPSQLAALKKMLKEGKSAPEILADAPEGAAGEAWRRKAMMRFASALAKRGSHAAATAIATASQWHNCQAFRCLLRHSSEVAEWLRSRP
jgi:hypothetical protein